MKFAFLSLIVAVSFTAFEADANAGSTIFCKNKGEIVNAFTEDGRYECAGALIQGDACFTGIRQDIIDLINDESFNWDEEWLESAELADNDAIAYLWVDGPNETQDTVTMKRCTDALLQ